MADLEHSQAAPNVLELIGNTPIIRLNRTTGPSMATVLAKLYSEAIEAIEPGPVEAVRATGATTLQVLRWGVLPQLVPQFLSFTLYRFETNIRAAAVLGFVGAGGIGFYIQTYLRLLNYPAAATVLLVLIVLVMIVDFASSRLRARLV